jgi:CBS domain containing-hemolysin-like protein
LGVEEEDDTFNRDEMGAMVNIIREEQFKAREHAQRKKQALLESNNKPVSPVDHSTKQSFITRGPVRDFFRRAVNHSAQPIQETRNVLLSSETGADELTNAEINVITGVLGLSKIKVRDICIPMSEVNMLSSDQILTPEVIDAIDKVGHSRLPVFRGQNVTDVVGFFIAKKLMVVNPDKSVPLSNFQLNAPIVVG